MVCSLFGACQTWRGFSVGVCSVFVRDVFLWKSLGGLKRVLFGFFAAVDFGCRWTILFAFVFIFAPVFFLGIFASQVIP